MLAGLLAAAALAVMTSGICFPLTYLVVMLCLIPIGILVLAWLALHRRVPALTTRNLYKIAALWSLPLAVARPLFSLDVWSYLAQGLIAAKGLDPYVLGPVQALGPDSIVTQHVSPYWVSTPAPYGPIWMALSRAVAEVAGDSIVPSVVLYRVAALAGVLLIGWALPRLALRGGVAPGYALWLGLLNPLVLWHLVSGVHNDALMLGLMLAGLELALSNAGRGRVAAGVALLTVAACVKVVAVAAICCVAVDVAHRRGRFLRPFLPVVLGATAGVVALSAVGGFGWITALRGSTTVYSWMSPTTGTGMLIGKIFGAHLTAPAVGALNVIGAMVLVVVGLRLLVSVHRGRISGLRAVGLIFAVAVMCGPVVQPWYLLWALLPLAVTARSERERLVLIGISAVVALMTPPIATAAEHLVAGYIVATTVIVGITGAVLLTGRGRAFRLSQQRAASTVPSDQGCPSP